MKRNTHGNSLWLMTIAFGVMGVAGYAQTFGTVITSGTDGATFTGSGTYTYSTTGGAYDGDNAVLPSTSTSLSFSTNWSVQLTLANPVSGSSLLSEVTDTSAKTGQIYTDDAQEVDISLGLLNGAAGGSVAIGLEAFNNTGVDASGNTATPVTEGTMILMEANSSSGTVLTTTPASGASTYNGTSYVMTTATSATVTLSYNASSEILTASEGDIIVGTYSLSSWNQADGLDVGIGGSSSGLTVPTSDGIQASAFQIETVPEPSTDAMLIFGVGALVWVLRRKKGVVRT